MNLINNNFHEADTDLRNEILEEVRNNLSQMKPDIISSIVEEVTRKIDGRYASQIGKLENRVLKLERHINDEQTVPTQQKKSTGTSNAKGKIDVQKINSVYKFRFDGWIYYDNRDMGGFLYRVREDGSENTQLTDYTVHLAGCKVARGYLYYDDAEFNEKKFKLS